MGEPLTKEQMDQAAALVLAFLTFAALAFGLLSALFFGGLDRLLAWRERLPAVNNSVDVADDGDVDYVNDEDYERPTSPGLPALATTSQNSNNPIATPAIDSNDLLLRNEAATLAKLVKAGKVGETEGIKLVYGVAPSSSNPRYLRARAMLKEELAKLEPGAKYNRTPEEAEDIRRKREELGLTA